MKSSNKKMISVKKGFIMSFIEAFIGTLVVLILVTDLHVWKQWEFTLEAFIGCLMVGFFSGIVASIRKWCEIMS